MPGTVTQLYSTSKVPEAHQYLGLLPYYYGIRPLAGLGTLNGEEEVSKVAIPKKLELGIVRGNVYDYFGYYILFMARSDGLRKIQ